MAEWRWNPATTKTVATGTATASVMVSCPVVGANVTLNGAIGTFNEKSPGTWTSRGTGSATVSCATANTWARVNVPMNVALILHRRQQGPGLAAEPVGAAVDDRDSRAEDPARLRAGRRQVVPLRECGLTCSTFRARLRSDDEGMTLVELLVAMVLVGVLGAIVSVAVLMSHKQVRIADDEATGLSDTRVVVERLGRDIRVSRGVDAGATESNLVLWIDYNSDYIRSATAQAGRDHHLVGGRQRIRGAVQHPAVDGRRSGADASPNPGRPDLAFCYLDSAAATRPCCLPTPLSAANAAPPGWSRSRCEYDSSLDYRRPTARTTTFTERIRNVS